jgi:hypothetical protein
MAGFSFESDGSEDGDKRAALKLRKKASELAATQKVKTFLELARAAGVGSPEFANLDIPARRRILTAHAVSHDAQISIRAIQELKNLDQFESETKRGKDYELADIPAVLDEIASLGPDCAVIARRMAEKANIDWKPKLSVVSDNSTKGAA